jgi:hypothetical protein
MLRRFFTQEIPLWVAAVGYFVAAFGALVFKDLL